jgi:anti-sigma B factor antagonist
MTESYMSDSGLCRCHLTIRRHDVGVVVAVLGELDFVAAPELARTLRDLVEDQGHVDVVMDLGGVTFIDSFGVRTLLQVRSTLCERGGRFAITEPSAAVRRILEILRLDAELDVRTGPADS